jgi:hypothetical protein
MWAHLWAKGPMPYDYLDLLLCERFHWSIQDLYDAPAEMVEKFLIMWEVETSVQKAEKEARSASVPTRHSHHRH